MSYHLPSYIIADIPLDNIEGIGSFSPTQAGGSGTPGNNFQDLISLVLQFLTVVAGLAFLLYFMLGAINWITAGGDAQKVEGAKAQMTNAGIGLVVVVAGYTIVGVASLILGFDILNPADVLGL